MTDDIEPTAGDETEDNAEPNDAIGRERTYRKRAQSAEAQVTELGERLKRHDLRAVETVAGEFLSQPGDFWRLGGFADVSEIPRDAQGEVDTDAVRECAALILKERPGLAPPDRARRAGPGIPHHVAGTQQAVKTEGPTWAQAFKTH